jgi:hypothetical protein
MFNKIFDSVTSSLSQFVLGWTIPSAVAIAIFALFDFPAVADRAPFNTLQRAAAIGNGLGLVAVFTIFVVTLSVLFAYTNRPIYHLLEGYTGPRALRSRLLRKQLRVWGRMRRMADRPELQHLLSEDYLLYPEDRDDVMPTRLGNALRAAETYGTKRFKLDTLVFWYELLAAAPEEIRRGVQQTRAAMDLFVSSIVHFALLAAASFAIAIWRSDWQAFVVGVASLLVLRPAYGAAVGSVTEMRYAMQALVHTGRLPLAQSLGFRLPRRIKAERNLWRLFRQFVDYGYSDDDEFLERFRRASPPPVTGA